MKQNSAYKKYVVLMLSLLMIGIIAGAASTLKMNSENVQVFSSMIESFMELPSDVFQFFLKESLIEGLVVLFLFGTGFSLLGIPVILLFLLIKGFKTGVICTLLIQSYQMKGIFAIAVSILPASCLKLIAELMVAIASMQLSIFIIQSIKDGSRKKGILNYINHKCTCLLTSFVFVGLYGAFQSTIGLWLIKAFQSYI